MGYWCWTEKMIASSEYLAIARGISATTFGTNLYANQKTQEPQKTRINHKHH